MKLPTNDEIIQKLEERGANRPCARCGNETFSVVATTMLSIQDEPGAFKVGGESVPCSMVACNRCGNMSFHALGALGLLGGAKE